MLGNLWPYAGAHDGFLQDQSPSVFKCPNNVPSMWYDTEYGSNGKAPEVNHGSKVIPESIQISPFSPTTVPKFFTYSGQWSGILAHSDRE